MIELRLRTRTTPEHIKTVTGKALGPADYDVLLTGPARVLKPDGQPLAVYLPGAIIDHATHDATYQVLHSLRHSVTGTRWTASASRPLRHGPPGAQSNRADTVKVPSTIIGSIDPTGQQRYCRLTAWTGNNLPAWQSLAPLLRTIGAAFAEHVPARHAAQMAEINRTDPAWVVPGTPFTTITVNNSWPTGVHKDKGDLETGFSALACLRRGNYTGGQLIFPEYRVAADLGNGDLLLMDAHEWHANTPLICACGTTMFGPCRTCGAERISTVAYFRSKLTHCGSPEDEATKATSAAERRYNTT